MSNSGPVSLATALKRGFLGKCPNCGQGHVFDGFLKVARQCEVCAEPFHHHRADDLPAYVVLLFVGHLVVTLLLAVDSAYAPPYWVEFAIWIPVMLLMSLGLLQPVKGAVVAMQWQMGMHGFDKAKSERDHALSRSPRLSDLREAWRLQPAPVAQADLGNSRDRLSAPEADRALRAA